MTGATANTSEVQGRWSHAELTGRFRSKYTDLFDDAASKVLQDKIIAGAAYEDLSAAEKSTLAVWNRTGFRRDFANAFNWYARFECREWTKEEVAALKVLDRIGGGVLTDLLGRDQDAPKLANECTFDSKRYSPIILGHFDPADEQLTIWEGNFRACLFYRTAAATDHLCLWVPVEGRIFDERSAREESNTSVAPPET